MFVLNKINLSSNPNFNFITDRTEIQYIQYLSGVRNFHSTKPALITGVEFKAFFKSKVVMGVSAAVGTTIIISQVGTDVHDNVVADACRQIVLHKYNIPSTPHDMAQSYADCVQKARKTAE